MRSLDFRVRLHLCFLVSYSAIVAGRICGPIVMVTVFMVSFLMLVTVMMTLALCVI